MAIVTLEQMKDQLGLTADQDADDALISGKIEAAQDHVERLLGYTFAERYPDPAIIPASLKEAVMQLAAWWFENREAVSDVSRSLPFGVAEIVNEYREWAF
ncbi:phage gp6-like head-tail connector protein [Paracoccus methylovorus]|uniref:Phage gp6-like head-tail connector protein n=1 Tax=Paracoccus methylovorus TaxID=2812658 RepID=A0ABX7JMB2_9RHOB|nr:head-tail connector protein [Paracoccus methylovorus]QRZ15398.1 phage gp6-like head-tail connector protein [Paracoccus methylovorus]